MNIAMYDIALQEIEYFVTAAERLNFTEAAHALYASQPVISKCIKKLEKELGLTLFIRDNRGVALTPEGELLYREWRLLLQEFSGSVKSAKSLDYHTQKVLRIGCLSEFEHELNIKEFLAYYEDQNPRISVSVELYGFKDLRDNLLNDSCDLILTYNSTLEDTKELEYKNLIRVRQYIALSSKHRLAGREDVTLQQLKNETFYILSPSESKKAVARMLEEFEGIGYRPRRVEYTPNLSSMAFAVSQGKGITVCHRLITRGYENDIRLIPFSELFNDIYLAVAWKRDRVTPELQKLLDLI